MATKKPPYSARVKVWLPAYTVELDGGVQGCVIDMFSYLPVEQQKSALAKIQERHQKALDREAEKASDAGALK